MGSVSILSAPGKLVLSGNPVVFKTVAQNYLKTVGVKAKFHIRVPDGVHNILSFETGPGTQHPSRIGNITINKGVGPNDWDGTGTTLAEFLSSHPHFIDLFDFYSQHSNFGYTEVYFYAKNYGPENPDCNFSLYIDIAGVSEEKNTLHRVIGNVTFDNKTIKIDSQAQNDGLSKAGQADFDLSTLLKKERTGHFTFPDTLTKFCQYQEILDELKVTFCETYGIPATNSLHAKSNSIFVLQGKLPTTKQGELNDLNKSFYDKLTETGQFLTDQPIEKYTDIYAPERLYWYSAEYKGYFKIRVKYFYFDGTSETKDSDMDYALANTVYEIQTNYKRIRKGTTNVISKYSVQVIESGMSFLSPVQTYIIDRSYQEHARYFLIRNCYGVYDCIRTTGIASKKRKITKQSITLPLPADFKSTDREVRQISSTSQITYSLNSGFLRDEEMIWASELLNGTDAYWLKKGKAYPVLILESDNFVYKDGEYNNYLEFDVQHANSCDITEEFTAQEPIELPGDYSIDFSTDWFTGAAPLPPVGNVVYQSDFSRWVETNDANFPLQPINTRFWKSVANGVVSLSNFNNQYKISFGNYDTRQNWVFVNLLDPLFDRKYNISKFLDPGTYLFKITLDIQNNHDFGSAWLRFGYYQEQVPRQRLNSGENTIELEFTERHSVELELFNVNAYIIISNITIEKLS